MPLSILDNFYLSEDELENSPSRAHGIDRETEATLRVYGCELVQEAGILLQFPQAVMATGQVLFQRFYCKRSMKDFNVKARPWARPPRFPGGWGGLRLGRGRRGERRLWPRAGSCECFERAFVAATPAVVRQLVRAASPRARGAHTA
jgi:hypothetical protein